jgi:hypothetical protein
MCAIYSGSSCNFPQPRKANAFLGGIDRLFILRATAPIRFPANKIIAPYEALLFRRWPDKTAWPMLRAAEKVSVETRLSAASNQHRSG